MAKASQKFTKLGAVPEYFKDLLDDPISFYPWMARLCGGVAAGLMLSQCVFWSRTDAAKGRDGWFYKSVKEWTEETCLGRREQDTARNTLRKLGILETEKRRQKNGTGQVLFYRIDFQRMFEIYNSKQNAEEQAPNVPIDSPDEGEDEGKTEAPDVPNGQAPNVPNVSPDGVESSAPNVPNVLPLHIDSASESYKEKTAMTFSHDAAMTHRGERPPFPSQLQKFMSYLDGAEPGDPARDRELMALVQDSALRAGLSYTQAKDHLGQSLRWRCWQYFDLIDSQTEIRFEEPAPTPQPIPIIPITPEPAAARAWEIMSGRLNTTVNRHSFDTWLKHIRGVRIRKGVLFAQIPDRVFKNVGKQFEQQLEQARALAPGIESVEFLTPEEMGETA